MSNKQIEILTGLVEIDETYIGGDLKNKHQWERDKYKGKSTGTAHKQPVFGMLERGGRIIVMKVPFTDKNTLQPIIRTNLADGSTMITDGHGAYRDMEYSHEVLSHNMGEYARGEFNTNSLEGFWSQLKRTIKGTHIHVSREHLQKYIDEVAFRFMNRNRQDEMFEITLSHVV